MLRSILFTHDDLDGAGCRIVYHLFNARTPRKEIDVINCANNTIDDRVNDELCRDCDDIRISPKDTVIYFADIVPSREVLQNLVKMNYEVKIFDHHRTNFFATWVIPDAQIIPENELGIQESGTSLLWKHFAERAMTTNESPWLKDVINNDTNAFQYIGKLVDTIRSYDTFEFKLTDNVDAKKLQMFFSFVGMEIFCKRYLDQLWFKDTYSDTPIILAGDDLMYVIDNKLENEQKMIDKITPDDVITVDIKGYKCAFAFPFFGTNVSELAYQFLRKYPDYDMYAMFSWSNGGEYSIRTAREDFNIGEIIAAPIGGGGHPKAAGAPITEDMKNFFVKLLVDHLAEQDNYCICFE